MGKEAQSMTYQRLLQGKSGAEEQKAGTAPMWKVE